MIGGDSSEVPSVLALLPEKGMGAGRGGLRGGQSATRGLRGAPRGRFRGDGAWHPLLAAGGQEP